GGSAPRPGAARAGSGRPRRACARPRARARPPARPARRARAPAPPAGPCGCGAPTSPAARAAHRRACRPSSPPRAPAYPGRVRLTARERAWRADRWRAPVPRPRPSAGPGRRTRAGAAAVSSARGTTRRPRSPRSGRVRAARPQPRSRAARRGSPPPCVPPRPPKRRRCEAPPATLVAGHRGIDLLRPGVDAADQVVDVAETEAAEVLGRLLAASAVVAMEDEQRVLRQALELRSHFGIEEPRGGDAPDRRLRPGARVEEVHPGPALEQPRQLLGVDRLHGWGRIRILDREVVAVLGLHVVDADAFGALGGGPVDVEADTLDGRLDLAGLH